MPDALMQRWISTFLDAQAAERDAARNTRLAYGRDLLDFAGWLAHRGRDFLTAGSVEEYVAQIESLLDAPGRAAAMGKAARLQVLARYSWAAHLSRIDRDLEVNAATTEKTV